MSQGQVRSGWPLNLELREWVLATLIFLKYPGLWGPAVKRFSPIRPTPYAISRFINSPVWPVEKSLRNLVKAGYVVEDLILPHNPEEARKLGQQIQRLKPKIPPRRYWHYYYYATLEGEDYLKDQLMVPVGEGECEDYNGYWHLVFRWLWEQIELPELGASTDRVLGMLNRRENKSAAELLGSSKHSRIRLTS